MKSRLFPSAGQTALDLLFPKRCALCGREGTFLCASCTLGLPHLAGQLCPACGLPVEDGKQCNALHPAHIEGLRSLWAMEGGARQLVHQLKYGGLRALAGPLGAEMAALVKTWAPPVEAVVPVPLHPRRLRERGFDQAELLAHSLSQSAALPLLTGLRRTMATPQQARTHDREERRRNMRDAFAWTGQDLSGQRLLLVDDVATTGATLAAAAQALRAAGASDVWAVTVAREL